MLDYDLFISWREEKSHFLKISIPIDLEGSGDITKKLTIVLKGKYFGQKRPQPPGG